MYFRKNKKKCIVYPEDKFKSGWDIIMTLVLLGACISTPLEIAFSTEMKTSMFDDPTSFIIDMLFLFDIILIFNTAYYNEEMELVQDRKSIIKNYVQGWFAIDFLAIVPFDVILNASQFNSLARVARVGRLYKLVKLSRLFRFIKVW